jgi:hypothetical protein
LELGSGSSNGETTKVMLQSSVERCLLLLKILANDNDNSSLPTSRHALLQAVLGEPLIPLNKQERQYAYMLQRRNKHDDDDESDDDNQHMEEDEEENVVSSTMDKRQLAREEQELVKLATRPIPNNAGVDQDVPPPDDDNNNEEAPLPSSIVQQGPLVWITTNNNNNKTPCHVELHACGVLILTAQDKPRDHYYLTNRTKCEPCVDSLSLRMSVQRCVSPREMMMMQPTELLVEFPADSSPGYAAAAWVRSIHRVIAKLKRVARLQNELRLEWGEEYDNAVKQMASVQKGRVQSYPR